MEVADSRRPLDHPLSHDELARDESLVNEHLVHHDEEDDEEDIIHEEELVHMEDVMDQLHSDEEEPHETVLINDAHKEFHCEYCNYATNRRSDLTRHVRIHTGENLHCCSKCDYRTSRLSDLRRHILLHAGEKPFKCGVCNYNTSRKAVLLKHMKIHVQNLPRSRVILVQVSKEGQKVINNNALASSVPSSSSEATSSKSPAKRPPNRSNSQIKMYQCDKCDFVAACRKNYHEHRLTHGKEQKWKCPTCGYMTIRKSDMTRHYNIHIDNVFKCDICEYKTVRQSDFIRHSRTHNKNK